VEDAKKRNDVGIEDALKRYAAALCYAKIAMGTTLADNMTFTFSWRDAFKPALVCHARTCDFERSCVLVLLVITKLIYVYHISYDK
jgi:hypothetical protein